MCESVQDWNGEKGSVKGGRVRWMDMTTECYEQGTGWLGRLGKEV